jgi:hypothetical protein
VKAVDLALGKGICDVSRITSYIAKVGVPAVDKTVEKLNEMVGGDYGS